MVNKALLFCESVNSLVFDGLSPLSIMWWLVVAMFSLFVYIEIINIPYDLIMNLSLLSFKFE